MPVVGWSGTGAPGLTLGLLQHTRPRFLRRIVLRPPVCVKQEPRGPTCVRTKTSFVAGGDQTMTACAIEPEAAPEDGAPQSGCTITVDGAYAARLALDGGSWFPERWTLDGPEPYAVPLPGNQPEEPGTEVQ